MADNNELAAVPAPYPGQQDGYTHQGVPVRLTPTTPVGTGALGHLTAAQMAELGAMLGSLGAEKGAVAAILDSLQSVTIQVWIQQLPMLLAKMQAWEKARFQRLLQAVRAMPEAPLMNQGILNRIMGTTQVPINSYVDRNEVMRLITQAMAEAPAV